MSQITSSLVDPNFALRCSIAAEYGLDSLPRFEPSKPRLCRVLTTDAIERPKRPRPTRSISAPFVGLVRRVSLRKSPRLEPEPIFENPVEARRRSFDVDRAYRIIIPSRPPLPTAAEAVAPLYSPVSSPVIPESAPADVEIKPAVTPTHRKQTMSCIDEQELRRAVKQAARRMHRSSLDFSKRPIPPVTPSGSALSILRPVGPDFPGRDGAPPPSILCPFMARPLSERPAPDPSCLTLGTSCDSLDSPLDTPELIRSRASRESRTGGNASSEEDDVAEESASSSEEERSQQTRVRRFDRDVRPQRLWWAQQSNDVELPMVAPGKMPFIPPAVW